MVMQLTLVCSLTCRVQPARVVCIEYPREPAKDEQYAWSDFHK